MNSRQSCFFKNNSRNINIGEKLEKERSPVLVKSPDRSEDLNKSAKAERDRNLIPEETAVIVGNKADFHDLPAHLTYASNHAPCTYHSPAGQPIILPAVIPPDNLKRISVASVSGDSKPVKSNNSSITGNSVISARGSRMSFGLIAIFKNTWLLNNETFEGLKSESLNSSEIVFFPDMGLSLNYSINSRWQIQADGFFFSRAGQLYYGYYYGHYARKEITLGYSTMALSVKYRFYDNLHLVPRYSVNLLAGGYISSLNQANQIINTDLQDIKSEYRKSDFGIRLGGEIELHLLDNFSLAPGLFLSLGIPNIYKGDGYIPGNLRITHNGSAEFHLTFYYHFD